MRYLLYILLVALCIFSAHAIQIPEPDKSARTPQQQRYMNNGSPRYSLLNVNNLATWMRSDGQSNHSPASDNGLYYPRFTSWTIYQDGLVWAAKAFVDEAKTQPAPGLLIRVGGATYGVGTQAGHILTGAYAVPVDPNSPTARIYRIRRDYAELINADGSYSEVLRRDAANYFEIPISDVVDNQMAQVYTQYHTDWNEWPVALGAPYIERNGIPGYQPPPQFSYTFTVDSLVKRGYDEPGISGSDHALPADQVIWTVYNDLDRTKTFGAFYSEPLGLEIQKTAWAYRRNDAFGNMYFTRHKIINKGGVDIDGAGTKGSLYLDSLYIGQWSDPDIGNAGDDLIGCDPNANLGYAYNGNQTDSQYLRYGLPPPAVGYIYFQGPIVASASDSAVFNLERRYGYKNLPMTSFGETRYSCPFCDVPFPIDTRNWWNHLRGYTFNNPPTPFLDHNGIPTNFIFSGDPINRTGYIDGLGIINSPPPGDRRILLSSGPISLAPGDTQEVLIGVVVGIGADHLSSIEVMKLNGQHAQRAFRTLFSVPRAPSPPIVKAFALDGEIILEWGSDIQIVEDTEKPIIADEYQFEGYNVYEFPSANAHPSEGVRIATFDLKNGITSIIEDRFDRTSGLVIPTVVQRGTDSGVQRYLRITESKMYGEFGEEPLRNGREYYWGVSAYNYTQIPQSLPRVFESNPVILRIKPQVPFGVQYPVAFSDTLKVTHIGGPGVSSVYPIIINPAAGTGDTYEVRVDTTISSIIWSLRNTTQNNLILENQTNGSGDENYHIVEGGILLKVVAPSLNLNPGGTYTYVSPLPEAGTEQQKASARTVGVFPNPFYADGSQDIGVVRRIVTFNNLPERATIRIYNLAGQLVRTLEKNNTSQFLEWNVTNEHNWQVASGIYICHVEMPDIGESKILKLAIIQPQIVPR